MKRGEVWWASLPAPVGSAPGYRRPVLVIQANSFNESRIATVLVAVISSSLSLAAAPGNVRLGKRDSGLPKASVVNIAQLVTLDRRMLTEKIRAVPKARMAMVDEGLRLALAL